MKQLLRIGLILLLITGIAVPALATVYNFDNPTNLHDVSFGGGIGDGAKASYADNGNYLFVYRYDNGNLRRYNLSTPYDISTANTSDFLQITLPTGIGNSFVFNDNGTELFVFDSSSAGHLFAIMHFHLSTAWDINSASLLESVNKDPSYYSNSGAVDGYIKDPHHLFVVVYNGNQYEYYMPDAYNVSSINTSTYLQHTTYGGANSWAIGFRKNGTKFYTQQSGTAFERTLSDPYNMSAVVSNTSMSSGIGTRNYISVSKNGEYLLVGHTDYNKVTQWLLSSGTLSGYVKDKNGNPIEGATVKLNSSGSAVTNANGYYSLPVDNGSYLVTVSKQPTYVNSSYSLEVNSSTTTYVHNVTLSKTQTLTMKAPYWIPYNSTVPYRVYWAQSDVTGQSIVTSSDTSLVAVNGKKLVSTANKSKSGQITITASYNGKTVTQKVTVANRTIDNIGIMSPSQYIGAFLGLDEPGTVAGIGSSIEWLYLAIALGAFVSWESRNEWLGVGTITVLVILFWVLGHVSLGVTMISTFFGLFALYQLQGIPSRSDTNVSP